MLQLMEKKEEELEQFYLWQETLQPIKLKLFKCINQKYK